MSVERAVLLFWIFSVISDSFYNHLFALFQFNYYHFTEYCESFLVPYKSIPCFFVKVFCMVNNHYSNQIRYLILVFFLSSIQHPESPRLEQPIHFSLLDLSLFGSGLSRLGNKYPCFLLELLTEKLRWQK